MAEMEDSLAGSLTGDLAAREDLSERIYDDLRKLAAARMAAERPDHTLQPTALANEAFLRMMDQEKVDLRSRAHFFALAATMMRRVLVDRARAKRAEKRGGARRVEGLDGSLAEELGVVGQDADELLALDEALGRLALAQPRQARVVELRFFGGLGLEETAEELGVSRETVKLDWRFARAWLNQALSDSGD
jgi:RNA polymerase sigma factor (TIGR02999 family)